MPRTHVPSQSVTPRDVPSPALTPGHTAATRTVRSVRTADRHPRERYDRARDLPGLLLMWPEEIADDTIEARTRLIKKLRRVLRQERQRGIAGHWTYDLARHAALYRAYRHELARHTGAAARATFETVTPRPRDVSPSPFSWPIASGPPHSWAPPSGSRAADPTWCGIRPASTCSGSAGGASAI